jgi:hypothetical protein
MGHSDINASMTPEDKTTIKASIETMKTKMPFMINLTPEDRQSLRKMGANRLSYGTGLNLAANAHPKALPGSFDLVDYNTKMKSYEDLREIYMLALPWFEGLENTLMATGAEIMTLSDTVYGHLKVEAKKSKDQNLQAVVREIGDQLKQHKQDLKSKTEGQ